MNDKLTNKLRAVLREMSSRGVQAVVLLKEDGEITWLGNVARNEAEAIAVKVGRDLERDADVRTSLH
jgi:hypothetical protein